MEILNKDVKLETTYLSLNFYGEVEINTIQKICQLKHLKHLNLSSSDLLDGHLEIIGGVESLELLDLDLTKITDQGLRFLKPLKKLKELRLKDNRQLTDECIEHLAKIESLELIHFGNTSITIEGLKRLLPEVNLKLVILDSVFKNVLEEVLVLSRRYPELEINLKGTGAIVDGEVR